MFIFLRSLIQIYACYQASMYFNEKIVRALLGCDLGEFQKMKRETILQRFTVDVMRVSRVVDHNFKHFDLTSIMPFVLTNEMKQV